eukprot:UN24689
MRTAGFVKNLYYYSELNVKHHDIDNTNISWLVFQLWFTLVGLVCMNYLIEGISGRRYIFYVTRRKRKNKRKQKQEKIQPTDTLPMCSWFSLSLVSVAFDLIISLRIFFHRFDIRALQKHDKGSTLNDFSEEDDFWFDFMADCGDGFNSSYEITRLLAQRSLNIPFMNDSKR